MRWPCLCGLGFLLALASGAPAALASGGLAVSPVSLELSGGHRATTLEVVNPGDEPIDVQVRLFAWTNDGSQERHTPSSDIGFSPPMFHLAAGARQIVRLAALVPATDRERAYRLYVDQLPAPPVPGRLQMPVRMVLPLFLEPTGAKPSGGAAKLRWQASLDPINHVVHLTAINDGPRRVKLLDLGYREGASQVRFAPGLAGYVLAQQDHSWTFTYSGAAESLGLTGLSEGGNLRTEVPFTPN